MKTRKFLTFLTSTVMLVACGEPAIKKENVMNQTNESQGIESITEKAVPSSYFFCNIIRAEQMNIVEQRYPDLEQAFERTPIRIHLGGKYYSYSKPYLRDTFTEFAHKLGDLPKSGNEVYYHVTPIDNATLHAHIANITVKALEAYNERYPQGANLKNILRVHCGSYAYVFDKNRTKPIGSVAHYDHKTLNGSEASQGIKHTAFLRMNSVTDNATMNGLVMLIELLEAPSSPKQKLQIRLELEDGTIFDQVAEVTIEKLK